MSYKARRRISELNGVTLVDSLLNDLGVSGDEAGGDTGGEESYVLGQNPEWDPTLRIDGSDVSNGDFYTDTGAGFSGFWPTTGLDDPGFDVRAN